MAPRLLSRDDSDNNDNAVDKTMVVLIIAIMLVVITSLTCATLGVLWWRSRARRRQLQYGGDTSSSFPLSSTKPCITSLFTRRANSRQQCIRKSSQDSLRSTDSTTGTTFIRGGSRTTPPSVFVHKERQSLLSSSTAPPTTGSPEIRITFPDEQDDVTGRARRGDVVVIHVADKGVEHSHNHHSHLEQHNQRAISGGADALPPYEASSRRTDPEGERFQSLDLERIGGLHEKDPMLS